MEKITDKINALPDGANYFSLEFFPPKTAMVSRPAMHATTGDRLENGRGEEKNTITGADDDLGLRKPPNALRAHVSGSATALRNRHLGCRRIHSHQIARTRGDLPAPIGSHNMSTLDMHEHEPLAHR
jgi:hypothetical protein